MDASHGATNNNEKLDLYIPEGDCQTLAGSALDCQGCILEEVEDQEHGYLELTVQQIDGVRRDRVDTKMVALQKSEAHE